MKISIIRDDNIKKKVTAKEIHGKFPYKTYLEIVGNSLYGRYIVVISNIQLNIESCIDTIDILKSDNISKNKNFVGNEYNMTTSKPNSVGERTDRYKVRETDILRVGNIPMYVFKPN